VRLTDASPTVTSVVQGVFVRRFSHVLHPVVERRTIVSVDVQRLGYEDCWGDEVGKPYTVGERSPTVRAQLLD